MRGLCCDQCPGKLGVSDDVFSGSCLEREGNAGDLRWLVPHLLFVCASCTALFGDSSIGLFLAQTCCVRYNM